jgi:1,3-beta-glucan synthase
MMVGTKVQGCEDWFFGIGLCLNQLVFMLTIMFIMDLLLQYIFVVHHLEHGLQHWTLIHTWSLNLDAVERDLPKCFYANILAMVNMEVKYNPKVLVLQIWNTVIISMYQKHLLSINHVQNLLYHQVMVDNEGGCHVPCAAFFISQGNCGFKGKLFPSGSEAAQHILFFVQWLITALLEALPVDVMSLFTVLTPHYSEKVGLMCW